MKNLFKSDRSLWQFAGFAVVSFLGTILHFLYDWTGKNAFAALFSGVNESTWEHMKLLFFPMFFFSIVESFFIGKEYKNFWCIKLKGTILGLALIPVIFYTLQGAFGTTPDWINIAIFFVSAAIAFVYETRQFSKDGTPCRSQKLAILTLCLITIAFWVFTFLPPEIPLFQNPIDGSFGVVM